MQLTQIETDVDGRELTARGTPLFRLSVHDNDMYAFPSHVVPWHWHDECEIVHVLEGDLFVELPGTGAVLHAGDAALIRSGAMHAMRPHDCGRCRMMTIVFAADVIGGQPSSVFYSRYVLPMLREDAPLIHVLTADHAWCRDAAALLGSAEDAYAEADFGFELRMRGWLSEFWLLVLQHAGSPAPAVAADPYIKDLLSFVHRSYASSLTLEDIARSAGISTRTCSRSFRQQLQMSAVEYLTDYRIRKASEMLLQTEESVTNVCFAVGFRDPAYFARTFRAATGMSPREYRRTVLAAQNGAVTFSENCSSDPSRPGGFQDDG